MGVHGEDKIDSNITIEGDKVRFNEYEALLEVEVLKREGKMRQAEAMLSLIRKQRFDKVKARYKAVAGIVGRNVKSITKGLDAAFDSDSDVNDEDDNSDNEKKDDSDSDDLSLKKKIKPKLKGKKPPISPEWYQKYLKKIDPPKRFLKPVNDDDDDDNDYNESGKNTHPSSSVCSIS